MTSRLGALYGPGDPFLNLWILGWDLHTLSLHPQWLLTGRVFDAPIFFPSVGTLAYSDHQLIQSVAVWPVYALTRNLTLCYNVVLLLSLILSAWAMFAFVRAVTGSAVAGYGAGLAWGFCPYRIAQLPHLQLQALYWMPLTFWLLHRLIAGRTTRDAVLLGLSVALQATSSVYYGVIGIIGLSAAAVVIVAKSHGWSSRLLWRLALAAVVAVLAAAPGLWPYWLAERREGFGRTLYEAEHNSATPASYLQAPPTNLIYGRTGWLHSFRDQSGVPKEDEPEQDLFPGFLVLALAIVGLVRARRMDLSLLAASVGAVGITGLLLSFGPRGLRSVYAFLYDRVFGFQAIRAPARFSVLVFFALAVLAGIGLAALDRLARPRSRVEEGAGPSFSLRTGRAALWPVVLALLLVALECSNGAIAFAPAPPSSTDVGTWLRDAPEPGPVLYLPIGTDREDSAAMVDSLQHGRPLVNGHSGQRPAVYAAIVDQVTAFPDSIALLTLRELGVRYIVVRPPLTLDAGPQSGQSALSATSRIPPSSSLPQLSPLVKQASFSDGVIYELRWTPEAAAAFDEADGVAPMPPGPLPFQTGETIRYRVHVVGGPMTLPAGEAVISSERDAEGRLQIHVRATTAAWMRSLFEADDELSVETDSTLMPRTYREALNEGRRHTRRTVEFDPPRKRVVVTNGDTAPVVLPLRASARDPVSALFYVRTLPLAAGFSAAVLVNDAGRNTTVNVKVTGAESIAIDNQSYEAWKVEPTFVTRLAWRAPPRATVWVSRDGRKVPLRIRVSAAFGTVELELVEYRAW